MVKWTEKSIIDAMKDVRQDLRSKGYQVAYICVYGSQNYGLDVYTEEYESDLDMKAVVIPTLEQLVNNTKQVTFTQDTKYGQVDVKDIRLWVNNLKKANPSYIETLFTEHYLLDIECGGRYIITMRSIAEDLCEQQGVQMVRAMYGMMKEKQKALCHPYPSIKHKIDKFGYDGKQLSHAIRLYDMMIRWLDGEYMENSLVPKQAEREIMIYTKMQGVSLEEAKELMNNYVTEAKKITDHVVENGLPFEIDDNDDDCLKLIDELKTVTIVETIKKNIHNKLIDNITNMISELEY